MRVSTKSAQCAVASPKIGLKPAPNWLPAQGVGAVAGGQGGEGEAQFKAGGGHRY